MFESKHFQEHEFACKCGCGLCNPDPDLVAGLDLFRDIIGAPVIIDDACRCEKHNAAVGGVPGSQHPSGTAADIRVAGKTTLELYGVARRVHKFFTGGIGLYDTDFIHVDVRQGVARWSRLDGKYCKLTDFPGYSTAVNG